MVSNQHTFIAGGTPAKSQGNKFTKGTGVVGKLFVNIFVYQIGRPFAKKSDPQPSLSKTRLFQNLPVSRRRLGQACGAPRDLC